MKVEEGIMVKTLVDKGKYKAGTIGLVVHVWKGGPECEVEVWDETMYPVDVVTYDFDEVEEVQI